MDDNFELLEIARVEIMSYCLGVELGYCIID